MQPTALGRRSSKGQRRRRRRRGLGRRDMAPAAAEPETDVAPPQKAVLRLSSQEWIVPGKSVREKADKILRWGGCGLEFGLHDVKQAEQIRKDLEGSGISPAAFAGAATRAISFRWTRQDEKRPSPI